MKKSVDRISNAIQAGDSHGSCGLSRHIYEKMQIPKRSELLNYLIMQRNDF